MEYVYWDSWRLTPVAWSGITAYTPRTPYTSRLLCTSKTEAS